jgi:hypothetical protein
MKKLLMAVVLLLAFTHSEAKAISQESWICLRNDTSERKLILVEDIDNYDWDGVSRPDRNWNGTYIEAGRTRCERAEVNIRTRSYFSFIIAGREGPHKVRMLYAICNNGGCQPGEGNNWRAHLTTTDVWQSILRGSGRVYRWIGENWQIGDPCDAGSQCARFTIQNVP